MANTGGNDDALPLGNGVEWAILQGQTRVGEIVVIQGPGQQGLACTVMAREAGARLVIVTGRGTPTDLKRLELARRLGAHHTINIDDEDLLERAGGMTSAAYPAGVGFFRDVRSTLLPPEFGADQQQGGGLARIGVDLPSVLENAAHRDNLIMSAGDSVVIPEYNPIIRVTGAVLAPAGVTWQEGRSLKHYVAAAGGYERQADRGRAYVVQPNCKVEPVRRRWFILPDGQPKPEPGAMIVVPMRLKEEGRGSGETTGFFTGLASILASTIAIIVVATR